MRKLIDAEKLSDQIRIMRTPFRDTMLAIVESMPDVGCARGQAHSGTQWCAEAVEMGKRMKGVVAKLEAAKEAHEEMDFGDVDKTWHDGYLDGISIATAHIRAAIGVEEGE